MSFQLSEKEWEVLKSQIVIAKTGRGGTRSLPYAFTEHGVLMLASVLRSNVAAQVSINISRTFAEMRRFIDSTTKISTELSELRTKIALLEDYCDDNMEAVNDLSEDMRKEIDTIYEALGALSMQPIQIEPKRIKIGFKRSYED